MIPIKVLFLSFILLNLTFLPSYALTKKEGKNVNKALQNQPIVVKTKILSNINTKKKNKSLAKINFSYPSFGIPKIDKDIVNWVNSLANAFEKNLNTSEGMEKGKKKALFELWGYYSITYPSKNAVSITFEVWNYVGNERGNMDIMTLNYNLNTGQRLSLVDIFGLPYEALKLMQNYSRKELSEQLGAGNVGQSLEQGTEALVENYSNLTLTNDGIRINFQPWQVTTRISGSQKVDMPLKDLLKAGPFLFLWDKTTITE